MTNTPLAKQLDGILFSTPDGGDGNAQAYQQNARNIGLLLSRAVLTVGLNAPPAAVDNDRHVVGTNPTGAWALHAGQVARKNSATPGGWDFFVPPNYFDVLNLADGLIYATIGGLWAAATVAGDPPGVVKGYAGATAPAGYLLCDGASYLRATYPALFAKIGTTYGSADGTHFNVPDIRGRMVVGLGANANVNTLGFNDAMANASRTPNHSHDSVDLIMAVTAGGDTQVMGVPTELTPIPYMVLNHIIKT